MSNGNLTCQMILGMIYRFFIYFLLSFFLSCIQLRQHIYLDVYQGEPIPFAEMIESLTKARLVYLGETHTLKRHHQFQLRVIEALHLRGVPLAIGLEMLPFTCQGVLDAWVEGKLEKKEFLRLVEWERNWGFAFEWYEPIFDFARSKGIKMLALNAPGVIVKKVAGKGIAGLDEEERGFIPPITPSSEDHRRYLFFSLSRHKTLPRESIERAYEAQDVWDSTMAYNVVEYLTSEEGKDKRVVVLAGSGHLVYGYGIPERVAKVLDLPYRIVFPTSSGDVKFQEEWEKYIEPAYLTHEDVSFIQRPIADFIFLVPLR